MITVKDTIYLTVHETAQLIDRSSQYVYQFHKTFKWSAYKYGQSVMFKKSDIEKWLETKIEVA